MSAKVGSRIRLSKGFSDDALYDLVGDTGTLVDVNRDDPTNYRGSFPISARMDKDTEGEPLLLLFEHEFDLIGH